MDNTKLDFSKKSICIITGGSRGLGKEIALQFAKKFKAGSALVLLARNQNLLDTTKQEIQQVNNNINVINASIDLTTTNKETLSTILNNAIPNPNDYENAVLIHNAGTIGTQTRAANMDDLDNWKKFYTLELFVPVLLTTVFHSKFKGTNVKMYIVNMTSLLGHFPMALNAQFGSGKAARDFYFKVMALEEPDVKILKYSPGGTKTDIIDAFVIARNMTGEDEKRFRAHLLDRDVTIAKLVRILENGEYKSGQFIDFHDDVKDHPMGPMLNKSRDF